MAIRRKNTAVKVITCILCILLAVGVVGGIAYMTGGFRQNPGELYVVYEGQEIRSEAENIVVRQGEPARFELKKTLGANVKSGECAIKVLPNTQAETDFDFTVGGQVYAFGAETDLTAGFDIALHDGYFEFGVEVWDMTAILSAAMGAPVEVPEAVDVRARSYFTLVVTQATGPTVIRMDIVSRAAVTGVELDNGEINF